MGPARKDWVLLGAAPCRRSHRPARPVVRHRALHSGDWVNDETIYLGDPDGGVKKKRARP